MPEGKEATEPYIVLWRLRSFEPGKVSEARKEGLRKKGSAGVPP